MTGRFIAQTLGSHLLHTLMKARRHPHRRGVLSGAACPTSSDGCRPRSPDLRWLCRRSPGSEDQDQALTVTLCASSP